MGLAECNTNNNPGEAQALVSPGKLVVGQTVGEREGHHYEREA